MKQIFSYLLGILVMSLLPLEAMADQFGYSIVIGGHDYYIGSNNKTDDSKFGVKTLKGTELAALNSSGSVSAYIKVVYNNSNTTYYLRPSSTQPYTSGTAVDLSSQYSNSSNAVTVDFSAHKTANDYYTFEMQTSSSSAGKLKVTYSSSTGGATASSSYYLVSPELTGGQMLPEFRLVPSRVRDGGALSARLYTLNLKDDRIRKPLSEGTTTIHYYIARKDGAESYRPHHAGNDNYQLGAAGTTSATNANVRTEQYNDTRTTTSDSNGTHMFELPVGTGVSYTWMFDTSANAPLTLAINLKGLEENTQKKYYAVGNFYGASAKNDIHPWEEGSRREMVRLIYKKGTGVGIPSEATFDAATMDSVVYRVTIPRPNDGWGELYMMMAGAEYIEGKTAADYNVSGDANLWNHLIRPQVQGYNHDNTPTGMDGTALEGGVFWSNTDALNQDQALNPQLTTVYADATSYTFSVNLTTSTYRISFNNETMWLAGVGVKGKTEGNTTAEVKTVHVNKATVENPDNEDQQWNAIPLTWSDEEQCFKNIIDGQETPVHFATGGRFRFVYGMDFTNPWFGEDGPATTAHSETNPNVPASLIDGTKPYTAYGPEYDTEYVNYLQTYQSSTNRAADMSKSLFFNLPQKSDGTGYIIRFYMRTLGDKVRYFYTIDRKISLRDVGQPLGERKYVRAFSEYHAMKVPEDVDVYFVTSTSATNKTVTLTKSTLDYIPARTGVILASDEKKVAMVTYAKNPEEPLPAGITNLLKAATADMAIPEQSGATYNYILGVYKDKLGFYHPEANVRSGRNYAYLESTANVTSSAAKGFTFVVEDEETTGITSLQTDGTADDAWYNLQGIQVGRPTTRGIYIHRGRKVVIR